MIYLYGFVDDPIVGLEGCRGFADSPLRSMTRGSVTAIFSLHDQHEIRCDLLSLRQHDKVVTTLMDTCTIAPARFGSMLADVDQLGEVLAERAPRLAPVLARLRGKSELAVRARRSDSGNRDTLAANFAPPSTIRSGRAYLLDRNREAGNKNSLHKALVPFHAWLACHAQAWAVRSGPDNSMVGAYLVAAGEVEAFRHDFVVARARQPRLRVSLTGPWAPYSFVEPEGLIDG